MNITTLFRYLFTTTLLCFCAFYANATHNRAGEIRIQQLSASGLTIKATVITYTAIKGPSQDADRDSLLVNWGDGSSSVIYRSNGSAGPSGVPQGEPISDNLQINIYESTHTYGGRGTYAVSMQDPNRIAGIKNIAASVNEVFYLKTTFTFLNSNFQGPNSTPILLQPPVDDGCVDQTFIHNPNAYDPDGDSLAYRLSVPLGLQGEPIASYSYPSDFSSQTGASIFNLNERTGTLTWNKPRQPGNYNAVILIISYRNGIAIDTTLRDMQIFIDECDNLPPELETETDFCLVSGDTITINPIATAPISESTQKVKLEVTSPTLNLPISPALWNGDDKYHTQPFSAKFSWITACEHSAKYPYNVIFKATDDVSDPNNNNLSTLKVVSIKVSAPPPENVTAVANNNLIDISWDSPYDCEQTANNYFFGFSVWRKDGSNAFPYDSCQQGLAGKGYTRLIRNTTEKKGNKYFFSDETTEKGKTYCYRVLGQFVRYTSTGRPFNLVESIPSPEVCIQSSRDVPLLTKVSVTNTDKTTGAIEINWKRPLALDFDTIKNAPPYQFQISRSDNIGTANFEVISTNQSFNSFYELKSDTAFTDSNLNTKDKGYTYQVSLLSNGLISNPPNVPSSSIFLNIASSDRQNNLTWTSETSWQNYSYDLLRQNGSRFDTIAKQLTSLSFLDTMNIQNGTEYCYQVVSYGSYGNNFTPSTIINNSQITCGVPIDTVAPCIPQFSIRTICDEIDPNKYKAPYTSVLTFTYSDDCRKSTDLDKYLIYKKDKNNSDTLILIGETSGDNNAFDIVEPIAVSGCYAIKTVDLIGNKSNFSPLICVENCPSYSLPNVFTPNNDKQNDLLTPRINRFISRVNFKLFNKWGVLVFQTEDPQLNWDGKLSNGQITSDGTYFYTCEVFQTNSENIEEAYNTSPLSGFIEVYTQE